MNTLLLKAQVEYLENILSSVMTTSDRKQLEQTLLYIKKKLQQ